MLFYLARKCTDKIVRKTPRNRPKKNLQYKILSFGSFQLWMEETQGYSKALEFFKVFNISL